MQTRQAKYDQYQDFSVASHSNEWYLNITHSSEMIFTNTNTSWYLPIPIHGSSLVYIHELVVRAQQLASVAQLESAAPESQGHKFNSSQGPKVAFFATVPG
jgi:hypothetical protein